MEKRPPPGFSTGGASPQSDTGLDSGKHSLRGRECNYGHRSAPQVPKVLPTTKISTHSFPPLQPPPPPPTAAPSMPIAPGAAAQMERLLAVLGEFTDHVSDMASLHLQRDNAKKHLARQEDELVKWQKHHAAFPPLAEQQQQNRASAQKDSDDLDKKLRQHVQSRDQLAKALAMSVISNQSDGGRYEGARVHFLEKQLDTTRLEIQRLRGEVKQASSKYGQIQAIQSDCAKNVNHIADMEFKLSRVMATSTGPPVPPHSEPTIMNLEKHLCKLQEKLLMLQDRVDGIPNLKLDLSKSKQEARDLNSLITVQVNGLKELNGVVDGHGASLQELKDTVGELQSTVVGAADEKGLIDVIANVEGDVEKLRNAMRTTNEELNGFHDELEKFGGRVATVERGTSRRETPQLATTMSKYDDSELRSGLDAIKTELTDVESGIATMRREQEEKDELVAADIDAVNTSAAGLDETVQRNRSEVEAAINRINASLSTLEARAAPPVTFNSPPTPVALSAGTGKLDDAVARKIHDSLKQHRQALERHRDNIVALERGFQQLDDRFNHLTTDQLAQNMVHQMSEMYPYAANVQAELDSSMKRDEQLRDNFNTLSIQVANLDQKLSNTQPAIPTEQLSDLQKKLDTLSQEVKLMRTHADTEYHALTSRIDAIESTMQTQTQPLKEGVSSLRQEVGALSAHIDDWSHRTVTGLGYLEFQVERLNEHCGFEFNRPEDDGPSAVSLPQKPAGSAKPDDATAGPSPVAAAVASASAVVDLTY